MRCLVALLLSLAVLISTHLSATSVVAAGASGPMPAHHVLPAGTAPEGAGADHSLCCTDVAAHVQSCLADLMPAAIEPAARPAPRAKLPAPTRGIPLSGIQPDGLLDPPRAPFTLS